MAFTDDKEKHDGLLEHLKYRKEEQKAFDSIEGEKFSKVNGLITMQDHIDFIKKNFLRIGRDKRTIAIRKRGGTPTRFSKCCNVKMLHPYKTFNDKIVHQSDIWECTRCGNTEAASISGKDSTEAQSTSPS